MAATALAGMLCVLVISISLRGYWHFDQFVLRLSPVEYYAISSTQGSLFLGRSNDPALSQFFAAGWTNKSFAWLDWDAAKGGPPVFAASAPMHGRRLWLPWLQFSRHPFVVPAGIEYTEITVPYWMIAVAYGMLAAAPWLRWRFSLRGLLVIVAAFAIFLGITFSVN